MGIYSEAYGVAISAGKIRIYIRLLSDLPVDLINAACERAAKECRYFPTPADIRERVVAVIDDQEKLDAERAWMAVKKNFDRWHPDIGLNPKDAAPLDAAGEYALRVIGGYSGFSASQKTNESFIRRDFLAAYTRNRTTANLLAPATAVERLRQIQEAAQAERKAIAGDFDEKESDK